MIFVRANHVRKVACGIEDECNTQEGVSNCREGQVSDWTGDRECVQACAVLVELRKQAWDSKSLGCADQVVREICIGVPLSNRRIFRKEAVLTLGKASPTVWTILQDQRVVDGGLKVWKCPDPVIEVVLKAVNMLLKMSGGKVEGHILRPTRWDGLIVMLEIIALSQGLAAVKVIEM